MKYIKRPNQEFGISHWKDGKLSYYTKDYQEFIKKITPFFMKHQYGFSVFLPGVEREYYIDVKPKQPEKLIKAIKSIICELSTSLKRYPLTRFEFYNSRNEIIYYLHYTNSFINTSNDLHNYYAMNCPSHQYPIPKLDEDTSKYWSYISQKLWRLDLDYNEKQKTEYNNYIKSLKSNILKTSLTDNGNKSIYIDRLNHLQMIINYPL